MAEDGRGSGAQDKGEKAVMYHPKLSYTQRGIPVISRKQMDAMAENYLRDFCPECLKEPCPIDIDQFAMEYLHLGQDFQYLTKQGVYLGMMVFHDTDRVEVYDEERDEAKYISEKANTIIIDRTLLEPGQEHRYRFTVGHECAHSIFHGPKLSDPYQEYLNLYYADSEQGTPMMFRCNLSDREFVKKANTLWTDKQWMEWQADAFSSSILMPKSVVKKVVDEISPRTMRYSKRDELIRGVSRVFQVSRKAAEIRLEGLCLIVSEEDDRQMTAALLTLETADRVNTTEEDKMFNYRDLELWGYDVPKTRGRRRKKS